MVEGYKPTSRRGVLQFEPMTLGYELVSSCSVNIANGQIHSISNSFYNSNVFREKLLVHRHEMEVQHVRSWRVLFRALRDSVDSALSSAVEDLLIHSRMLVVASSHVPPEEVAADIIFLLQLTSSQPEFFVHSDDVKTVFDKVCCLVMEVSSSADMCSVPSYGPTVLNFIVEIIKTQFVEDTTMTAHVSLGMKFQRSYLDSLQALGKIIHNFGGQLSSPEVLKVCTLLLDLIKGTNVWKGNVQSLSQNKGGGSRIRDLEAQRFIFVALTNILTQCRSSISSATFVEILKTSKDYLEFTTRRGTTEDSKSSRLYSGILRCLQLVISDMNGPVGEFVGPLVTCIVPFFDYGLHNNPPRGQNMKTNEMSSELESRGSSTTKAVYKPPHLRKALDKTSSFMLQNNAEISNAKSHPLKAGPRILFQSDSEQSDSDGSLGDGDRFNCSKVRMLAVLCTQELARADPKSVHAYWVVLFPTNDVLSNRRLQNSLMKTLLYDPILKVRMAAVATLSLMLEGPSRAFMQIAEYKEAGKFGSFVTLSYSLGQVLVQLHRGLSHLISNEPNIGLLVASLKALSLFLGAAPFSRLPRGMLPDTIQALLKRLKDLLSAADQTNAPCMVINSIGCALNTVPSEEVSSMLIKDIGGNELLQDLFYCIQAHMLMSVRVEALEALKLAVHNYPMVMIQHWIYISPVISAIIKSKAGRDEKLDVGHSPNNEEKVVHTAVKLLNEFLRAASGTSLTDDAADEMSLHSLHSSRPLSSVSGSHGNASCNDAAETAEFSCWSESLQEYLPILIAHPSALVRAEAVTCFAGLTHRIFLTLPENARQFVISSVLEMAENDESPAARSAASRAIGVIISYPSLVARSDILASTVDVIVHSTRDASIAVRITASWALANLCDALRFLSENKRLGSIFSSLLKELAECAMGLAEDNDKVRANAVRALGNLARFMKFDQGNAAETRVDHCDVGPTNSERTEKTGSYHCLKNVLQTFVSCVTTGNVKVQWNVCHALGNLFLNKSIVLSEMKWSASAFTILLLLLRDAKNFKIRIQAALALAAPDTRSDYRESYYDVIQALVLALDTLDSSAEIVPPGFKYVNALRDQLTRTCIHVLAQASREDCRVLHDFLLTHASFFEGWLRSVYSAINANEVSAQSLKNELTEGRSSNHLTKHKLCTEKLPRERTWYAFNDKDPLLRNQESSIDRHEVKHVAESLIHVYRDAKHTNLVTFLEQLLIKCTS